MSLRLLAILLIAVVLAACYDKKGGSTTGTNTSNSSGSSSSSNSGSSNSSSVDPNSSSSGGSATSPIFMGSNKLRIGGLLANATATAAPFDVRYQYVHSQPALSQVCYQNCLDSCKTNGWWGCWGTYNQSESGIYISWWNNYVTQVTWQNAQRPQIFHWTWYSLRDLGDAAGEGDGPGEVRAVNDTTLLTHYMNDFRFFLQKIGYSRVMVHLEPDFWGFARSLQNGNPHLVPAQVTAANPTDCATQENSVAGLARCLISMVRKYAPNATVGLHASCWDWQTNVQACGQYMKELGAANGDFMVTDVSDRDAGWYDTHGGTGSWWDSQKATAYLSFVKTLSESVHKPMVLWQIPVGNATLDNTLNRYKDDKVDYLFSHMNQVADAHVVALLFGAGHNETTTPETDGGNLVNKTVNYWKSGGVTLR